MISNADVELVNSLLGDEDTASAELLIVSLSERLSWAGKRYRSFNVSRTAAHDAKFL